MTSETYLGLIKKLDILIYNEQLDKENIFTLATKTTQENDGMPHAQVTSDKVGNLSTKLLMKEQEIDHIIDVFVDLREEIKGQIRKIPADECDVLYKYYVLNLGLFDIADDKQKSVDWIKKLKCRGISHIKINESETYKEACELLFQKK